MVESDRVVCEKCGKPFRERPASITVFKDLQEVVAGLLIERFQTPRIKSWTWPRVRCSLA
jgi:hypothetical protein